MAGGGRGGGDARTVHCFGDAGDCYRGRLMSVQAITWALGVTVRSATHKAVLLVLANYADEDGLCWPSQARLAAESCTSARTVRRVLQDLVSDGLISRAPRRRPDGTHASDLITVGVPPAESEARPAAKLTSGQIVRKPNPPAAKLTSGQIDQRPDCPQPAAKLAYPVEDKPLLEPTIEPSGLSVGAGARCAGDPPTDGGAQPDGPPVGAPTTKAELDALMARVFAVAGPGLADPMRCGGLHLSGPVLAWLNQGCSLDLDVLPVVQALTAKPRADPIAGWQFFDRAVRKARDVRLSPPPPEASDVSPHAAQSAPGRAPPAGAAPIGLAAHVATATAVRRRGAIAALREHGELDTGPGVAERGDVIAP